MDSEFQNARILLVDENREHQLLLKVRLQKIFPDASVVLAENHKLALKLAQDKPPEIMIMNFFLPQKVGIELLTALPKPSRGFPILAVSIDRSEEGLNAAIAAGADDYLATPMDDLVFRSKVESLLGKRYVSQFSFFGTPEGLAPIQLNFPLEIEGISEKTISFQSPVQIAKGTEVRVTVGILTIPCVIQDCMRLQRGELVYRVMASVVEDAEGMTQGLIRKLIVSIIMQEMQAQKGVSDQAA